MPMTARQMLKLLERNGFVLISQNGSHAKMYNAKTNITTIVPIHCKDLPTGTEKAILKQAGLK